MFRIDELDETILTNLALFDEILLTLGEPKLLENHDFKIVEESSVDRAFLVVATASKKRSVLPLTIFFTTSDLRIDIDGIDEAFWWSNDQIEKDRKAYIAIIENLLTGFILIDYRGSSHFVQIFNSAGDFADSFSRNNWLHMLTGRYLFRFKDSRKLFLPLFYKS